MTGSLELALCVLLLLFPVVTITMIWEQKVDKNASERKNQYLLDFSTGGKIGTARGKIDKVNRRVLQFKH